jgi:hypothetical protein
MTKKKFKLHRTEPMSEGRLMGFGGGQLYKFLQMETVNLLRCNKKAITIANSRAFLHTPLVSSTL